MEGNADLEDEAALIAGFVAGGAAAELALVEALRPQLQREVRRNWRRLWRYFPDLEQGALLQLWELRRKGATLAPPLAALAKKLVDTPARRQLAEVRAGAPRRPPLPQEPGAAPTQEAAFAAKRLLELATELPEGQAEVLLAHAAFHAGRGPALAEALGIPEPVAQKRLLRAQAALFRRAAARETAVEAELAAEKEVGDERA